MTQVEAEIRVARQQAAEFPCPETHQLVMDGLNLSSDESSKMLYDVKDYLVLVVASGHAGLPEPTTSPELTRVLTVFRSQNDEYTNFCLHLFGRVI